MFSIFSKGLLSYVTANTQRVEQARLWSRLSSHWSLAASDGLIMYGTFMQRDEMNESCINTAFYVTGLTISGYKYM
jgi:hypothetical protein